MTLFSSWLRMHKRNSCLSKLTFPKSNTRLPFGGDYERDPSISYAYGTG